MSFFKPLQEHHLNKCMNVKPILDQWVEEFDKSIEIPPEIISMIGKYSSIMFSDPTLICPRSTHYVYNTGVTETTITGKKIHFRCLKSSTIRFYMPYSAWEADRFTLAVSIRDQKIPINAIMKYGRGVTLHRLKGYVEMYSLNKLRLWFDYKSMKVMMDSIAGNPSIEDSFKIPMTKEEFKQNIKDEYVTRARKVIQDGMRDSNFNGKQLDENEIKQEIDEVYKDSKYFHRMYQKLCSKYKQKSLSPYVGTDNWVIEFNAQKTSLIVYFDQHQCSQNMTRETREEENDGVVDH